VFEYNGSDIFYPEADSIKIGDTIYLSCIIRKSDLPSNLYKQENLGGNLIVSSVDSFTNSNRGAVQSFNYFNIQGQLYSDSKFNPGNVKQIRYLETDSSYNLLVAIISRVSGPFVFTFTDVPGVHWSGAGKCGTANMMFDNLNENKHLYIIENKYGPLSSRDSIMSYCFVVK